MISPVIMLILTIGIEGSFLNYGPLTDSNPEFYELRCPNNCVCQHAPFDELPVARWITNTTKKNVNDMFQLPAHAKLATCLLQIKSETSNLLNALPIDLKALILLYIGSHEHQFLLNSSSLRKFSHLTTFEFRGKGAVLIIDEPLDFLLHANFEHILLQSSDSLKRPKLENFPSKEYEYRPPTQLFSSNEYPDKNLIQFKDEAAEIITYEEHVQKLKQTRMPSFYGWDKLEVLRIHGCHLKEIHWQMFNGLTNLKYLSLERNAIKELPSFAFSGALHLKSISLAQNALVRLHYLSLAGLLDLEILDLSDNQLSRLSEQCFPPLPKLLKADLRNNPIKHIFPATFWVMNSTRELKMGSEMEALDLRTWNIYGQFDSLFQLKTLSLSNVSTEAMEQGLFKGLYGLEILTLRGSIISIQYDAFAGMEKLRDIDISHCMIRELSMDAFIGAKKLQLLNLSHNCLSYFPPGLLDEQLQLHEVQLQGNQLTSLSYSFFYLPRLRVVRLDQNPWHCTCQMSNWTPRITNVMRGPIAENCRNDISGNPNSCRIVTTYKINKNIVPRCANFNGRSVYYVLRKQLHCGSMEFLHHSFQKRIESKTFPYWLKLELQGHEKRNSRSRLQTYKSIHHQHPKSIVPGLKQYMQKTTQMPQLSEISNEI